MLQKVYWGAGYTKGNRYCRYLVLMDFGCDAVRVLVFVVGWEVSREVHLRRRTDVD